VVTLIRLIEGKPAVADALPNEHFVNCPRCAQTYRLGYDDAEWHRVKDWLKLAETALRRDHETRPGRDGCIRVAGHSTAIRFS
jgi:hypothetical protein